MPTANISSGYGATPNTLTSPLGKEKSNYIVLNSIETGVDLYDP